MIVPANRLLWSAACIALPAASIAGFAPALAAPAWGVVGAWAFAAGADAWRGVRRLRAIGASTPEQLRLTRNIATPVPLAIQNSSGAPLPLRIAPELPESIETADPVLDVAVPAGTSSVPWTCTASARGDHRLRELHLEAPSPMGLWSVRDRFEDIHWKATARRAYPMVKLYSIEHAQEVYAVIDASRLSARDAILDRYVDAALHLALVADKQRDRFGLLTFADRAQSFVRARSGMDHFRLCREAIYRLRPERVSPDFREVFTTLGTNLRRRALLVFFTSLDDGLLAESFERDIAILARRHLVLVHVMPPPEAKPVFAQTPGDTESAYAALAGQLTWNRLRKLQIALQNRGVRLSFVDPERIKMQVSTAYLEVKRRQAL